MPQPHEDGFFRVVTKVGKRLVVAHKEYRLAVIAVAAFDRPRLKYPDEGFPELCIECGDVRLN